MKRFLLCMAAAALSACSALPTNLVTSPAPLAQTTIDEQKLDLAWRAYDAALDAINVLIDAKVIVPGSARALAIANANDRVLAGFTAAEHARAAGSTTDFAKALAEAQAALADIRIALRSK